MNFPHDCYILGIISIVSAHFNIMYVWEAHVYGNSLCTGDFDAVAMLLEWCLEILGL